LALRSATLARVPGFRAGPRAEAQLASLWTRAEALGVHHLHRADAQVMAFRDPETWFGGPATLCFVDRDPRSTVALAAVAAALRALREVLDETTWLEVDAMDLALVHVVLDAGFAIDSVQQVGDPRVGLARLIAAYDPPPSELVPATRDDVDGVITLHHEVFTQEPERCFFGAYPEHLLRMRKDLQATLRAARHDGVLPLHWVLRTRSKVVVHVEAEVHDHPWWGKQAGLALVLDPSVRGQGLVKSAYRQALTAAVARGAELIKGGTSQPAVMGLGRVMARPWYAFGMRRHAQLPPEHFLAFHPSRAPR